MAKVEHIFVNGIKKIEFLSDFVGCNRWFP